MEHVEVLRHMKETIKAIMPSEVAALDAAIAALSATQPPAEAQPVDGFRGLDSTGRPLYGPQTPVAVITSPGTAPPSAPVGVEAALRDALQGLIDFIEIDNLPIDADAVFIAKRALAQQPAAVDKDVAWIRLCGSQGEPAGAMTVTAELRDGSEVVLIRDTGNEIDHAVNLAAALAGQQQGGRAND